MIAFRAIFWWGELTLNTEKPKTLYKVKLKALNFEGWFIKYFKNLEKLIFLNNPI